MSASGSNSSPGFLEWDTDPYLVITEDGRLVWMVDGYTTSDAHPYSRDRRYSQHRIRQLHAQCGEGHGRRVRRHDQLCISSRLPIPSFRRIGNLFPTLFHPASEMPADLRAHARYPEMLFRAQAEIYRTYHMLDPQAFYNKEDVWDIARYAGGQNGQREPMTPTYVVASLPEQDEPEFMLILPFTPRTKDNLIGLMVGRCDGDNLGELVVLQLSKQQLIFGPDADRSADQSGPEHFEGSDAVEPAGLAGTARPDARAAGRTTRFSTSSRFTFRPRRRACRS